MSRCPLSPQAEVAFDRAHPLHRGHRRTMGPVISLTIDGYCEQCSVKLPIPFVLWVLHSSQTPTPIPTSPKDYPHTCPRCGGAAYVGGGPGDVDCPKGCYR